MLILVLLLALVEGAISVVGGVGLVEAVDVAVVTCDDVVPCVADDTTTVEDGALVVGGPEDRVPSM